MAKHAGKFELVDDLMSCKSEDFKKKGLGVQDVRAPSIVEAACSLTCVHAFGAQAHD